MVFGRRKVSPVVAVTGKNDAPDGRWNFVGSKVGPFESPGARTSDSQEVNSRHSDEGGISRTGQVSQNRTSESNKQTPGDLGE